VITLQVQGVIGRVDVGGSVRSREPGPSRSMTERSI
jgi:hypothetical protein